MKTEMTTTLRELLDAAYEASSIDCHVSDKERLHKAVIAFEISEGIACNLCHQIDCDRATSDDGDDLCVADTGVQG